MGGFLLPQRFEGPCGVRPALGEEVTETEEVVGLQCAGLIVNGRFEWWDSFKKIVLTKISKADIQANSWLIWHQVSGLAQHFERAWPLLAAHGHDAKVRVGAALPGIDLHDRAKILLGCVEVAAV